METPKTTILLNPQELSLVQLFLEHLDFFVPLIQADVFGMKNGNVTIHFDKNGKLQLIEKKTTAYRLTNNR